MQLNTGALYCITRRINCRYLGAFFKMFVIKDFESHVVERLFGTKCTGNCENSEKQNSVSSVHFHPKASHLGMLCSAEVIKKNLIITYETAKKIPKPK